MVGALVETTALGAFVEPRGSFNRGLLTDLEKFMSLQAKPPLWIVHTELES
jgi:hypothetical protein